MITCSVLEHEAEPQLRMDSTADGFPATGITPASLGEFGKMMCLIKFRTNRKTSLFFYLCVHVVINYSVLLIVDCFINVIIY